MTLKKIIYLSAAGACIYGLLSYHLVFVGNTMSFLRKTSPSFNYTFFSTHGKSNKTIMAIKELREAGVGDLLVRLGKMTEEEKEAIMESYSE